MSKTVKQRYSLEVKKIIETMLNEGYSITKISNAIKRDRSNIAKEITKHRTITLPSTFNNTQICLKANTCTSKSFECFKYCKNIEVSYCPKLTSSPHVCNGCDTKRYCKYAKYYYKATEAHCEYQNEWKNDRIGIRYSEEELNVLNTDFYYLVLQTKSIYHSLLVINRQGFHFKQSTIYKQIERNQLKLKLSDLPRKQSKRKKEENIDTSYKRIIDGHTYEDFKKYKESHLCACETQMDTVEGIKENNAPVILTLEIVKINFLFMFKIDRQTIDYVVSSLLYFKNIIGENYFDKIVEILLTDNGKEFINIDKLMTVSSSINLFYCHPYSSFEKGSIENNHELIRRVIPKGVSLRPYTQKELNLLCSHINSLYRKSLDGVCPFDLITQYIPLDKINELDLYQINPSNVSLIPELLGNKNVDNIKKYLDEKEIQKANIRFLTDEEKHFRKEFK